MSASTRRAGLSLLEVMVSVAILSLIALAMLSASVPLSDASRDQATSMDLDRDAMRFFAQLRREVRQSGTDTNGTPRLRVQTTTTAGDTLEFYVRQLPGTGNAAWSPNEGASAIWTAPIRYRMQASNEYGGRFRITRTEGGLTTDLLDSVQSVAYSFPANSRSITVTLRLVRSGTKGTNDGAAPADVVRTYTDQIEMMNQSQQ